MAALYGAQALSPEFKRARGTNQKDQRRQEILDCAARLMAQRDYATLSVQLIAQEAGIVKGTLYLYFKTKEELFLSLHLRESLNLLELWALRIASMEDWGLLPKVSAELLAEHSLVMKLLVITNQILEHNITFEKAQEFKWALHRGLLALGGQVEERLGWMKPGQGVGFISHLLFYAMGLWPACDQAPIIKEVYAAEPQLGLAVPDFSSHLEQAASWFLEGMSRG
ncbi:MAG: TetR family transcriptional regulator [bacterium]|nr:TetR family transcriptional regulator [bacterium]